MATTTMADRPADFDARVVKYQPGLNKLAMKLAGEPERAATLVSDTVIWALANWYKFRPPGDGGPSGFWAWLQFGMRAINSNYHRVKRNAVPMISFDEFSAEWSRNYSQAASQEQAADLAKAVRRLDGREHGEMVLRVAIGDTMNEAGAHLDVSTSRIQQIIARERQLLEAA